MQAASNNNGLHTMEIMLTYLDEVIGIMCRGGYTNIYGAGGRPLPASFTDNVIYEECACSFAFYTN